MPKDNLQREPFTTKRLEEERKLDKVIKITTKFNKDEQEKLSELKKLLLQSKDGTAIKQSIEIATKVLLREEVKEINAIILNNYRKNKRLNIVDFD